MQPKQTRLVVIAAGTLITFALGLGLGLGLGFGLGHGGGGGAARSRRPAGRSARPIRAGS